MTRRANGRAGRSARGAALLLAGALALLSSHAAEAQARNGPGYFRGYSRPPALERGYAPRGERGGFERRGWGYPPPPRAYPPAEYGPRGPPDRFAYGEAGGRRFARGQVLPPAYWGGAVVDPRAYRLRRPPNGYGWVLVGPNAYLMQRSTGLILDTAPLY